MAVNKARAKRGPYRAIASEEGGSTYEVRGPNSKAAGRSMAFYKATGMVDKAAPVKGCAQCGQ